jgi:hypothetical protein
VIGHDAPSVGAAERRFGGLICLRRYWRSKITSNWEKADLQKKRGPGSSLIFNYAPSPTLLPRVPRLETLRDGRQRQDVGGPGRPYENGSRLNARAVQVQEGPLPILVWRFGFMLRRRCDAPFRFGYVCFGIALM